MATLITGVAGFIGCHLARRLLMSGEQVVGIDNLNDYYDPELKKARLKLLENLNAVQPEKSLFKFSKIDLADDAALKNCFKEHKIDKVVNLAAQPGVRYSLINPQAYINSNLVGFANLLECCRNFPIKHLVYASSSSVYGLNEARPYSTRHNVDHPASLYAATKKSGELMAHVYSHLYGIPSTGLRFFTVYGPWGRPDMALYLFTDAILKGTPIKVFNHGKLRRDFTYIDDIVEGITRILNIIPGPDPNYDGAAPDPSSSSAPWKIYNIGNNHTIELEDFISQLEDALGKKAIKEYLPMQPGDVESTWADVMELERVTGFRPDTPLREGLESYVKWHKEYYKS